MKFTPFVLPLVKDERSTAKFYIWNFGVEWWLAYNLNLFSEITWELRKEAENESIFLGRFDDIVLIVAIKFELSIFEATGIDFRSIFEDKLKVDSRITNIFYFYFFPFNVSQLYIEIQL